MYMQGDSTLKDDIMSCNWLDVGTPNEVWSMKYLTLVEFGRIQGIKINATRENKALSKNNQKHSANILWGKGVRHNPIVNIHSYFIINGHIFLLFLEYVEEIGGKKWAILRQHAIVMTLHN